MKQQNKQMTLCIRRILFINQPTLDVVGVLKRVKNYLDSPNRVETLKNGPVNKLGEATKSLFELLTFLTPQPHATKKKSRAHGTLLLKTTPKYTLCRTAISTS
jgi:hypothetical protein